MTVKIYTSSRLPWLAPGAKALNTLDLSLTVSGLTKQDFISNRNVKIEFQKSTAAAINTNLRRDNLEMRSDDEIRWTNVIILSVEDPVRRRRLLPIEELSRRRLPAAPGVTVNTKIGVPKTIGARSSPLTVSTIARSLRSQDFGRELERNVKTRISRNMNIPLSTRTRVSTATWSARSPVRALTVAIAASTPTPVDNTRPDKGKFLPRLGFAPLDDMDSQTQQIVVIGAGALLMLCCCGCIYCQRQAGKPIEVRFSEGSSDGRIELTKMANNNNAGSDKTAKTAGRGSYTQDRKEQRRQAEENKKRGSISSKSQKEKTSVFGHLNNDYMGGLFDEDDDQNREDQHDHEMTMNQRDSEATASDEEDTASSDSGEEALVFRQFIENLKRIGFFKGMREKTAEYDRRYMTAKKQFQAQYQSSIDPYKLKPAQEAPTSPVSEDEIRIERYGNGRQVTAEYRPRKTEV